MGKRRKPSSDASAERHHPRSPYYSSPPDFERLAELYEEFRPFVRPTGSGYVTIDWNDPQALLAVTRVLLRHDFGLQFSLPEHHLCPPVPQRLNYICWIEELLSFLQLPSGEEIWGIDIGTGASAIFPLLGQSKGWKFLATEIDPESVESARKNISDNRLEGRIEVVQSPSARDVLVGVIPERTKYHFTVCNPPFFDDLQQTGLNAKRVCRATPSELVCPGGEVEFVAQIVRESVVLRDRISWFTTMIGKKSSLIELQRLIRDVNPVCVRTTTFTQGKQARWGLAWTFTPDLHVDQMSSTPSDQNLSAFAVPLGLASIVDPISVFISQRCWGMTVKSPILLLVYRSQDPEQRSAPSDFRIDLLPVSENVTRVKVSPRDNQRPDTVASFLAELKDHLPRPTPR
ncbi:U6 small nuclear RNA (adenine-(43)-N(6))-methyltransferase [Plasmodiophora brassicae]|uniref:U6 small nuclear RNA (adenine-(43)-N(6))-methyltransferase n=1 Tax=Plasmodiophora brassicae TaxID=37360 RepID=A0A0G4J3Z6_PLABS|nr:hypothetical protein PBRA_002482 [Plasmodiophora brassicae]